MGWRDQRKGAVGEEDNVRENERQGERGIEPLMLQVKKKR